MSLAFTEVAGSYNTMIVRVNKEELDELPIDSALTNLESFCVALNSTPDINDAVEYTLKKGTKAEVGEYMPNGDPAYRVILRWHPDRIFDTAKQRIEKMWKVFSKGSNHKVTKSVQEVYTDDGEFDFYIGL